MPAERRPARSGGVAGEAVRARFESALVDVFGVDLGAYAHSTGRRLVGLVTSDGDDAPMPIEFSIDAYMLHMWHHPDQVVDRGSATPYRGC